MGMAIDWEFLRVVDNVFSSTKMSNWPYPLPEVPPTSTCDHAKTFAKRKIPAATFEFVLHESCCLYTWLLIALVSIGAHCGADRLHAFLATGASI